MWEQRRERDYITTLGPWAQQLSNIDARSAFSLTYVNISPQSIAPECQSELLKLFGARDLDELKRLYAFMLRIDDPNGEAPKGVLTITSRAGMKSGLFEKAPMDYLDCIPDFDWVRDKNGRKQVIVLREETQYSARLTDLSFTDEPFGLETKWEFPAFGIAMRKLLDEKTFYYLSPQVREEFVNLYQVWPINEPFSSRANN